MRQARSSCARCCDDAPGVRGICPGRRETPNGSRVRAACQRYLGFPLHRSRPRASPSRGLVRGLLPRAPPSALFRDAIPPGLRAPSRVSSARRGFSGPAEGAELLKARRGFSGLAVIRFVETVAGADVRRRRTHHHSALAPGPRRRRTCARRGSTLQAQPTRKATSIPHLLRATGEKTPQAASLVLKQRNGL